MSDTPRTDDKSFNVYAEYAGRKKLMESDLVEAEFTRQLERELNSAKAEIADNLALIKRMHRAISARMCADEPTGEERLELHRAWQEAGAVLDQPASLSVRPNAAACGQSANSADNLRTRETPDYGEPWMVGRIDRPMEDRHKHDPLMLHRTTSRAVFRVNACQGMADPAVEIQAMKAAIEEAETSLTDIAEYWNQDENEVAMADACWHAVGTAQKAITKLQPFLTQKS